MSDLGLLTMLAVRLRSRGTAAVIAETVVELHAGEGGDRSAHVDRILAAAVDDGRVRRRGEEGRHSLTPAGEAELNALLSAIAGKDVSWSPCADRLGQAPRSVDYLTPRGIQHLPL